MSLILRHWPLFYAPHNFSNGDIPAHFINATININSADVDLYTGGIFLGCRFGLACLFIWAIGILAAGQSSTMTGTYSGQFAMEGFLNMRWKRWQRVLFTRSIAILPTLFVTVFKGIEDLTGMNDFLNVLMSIQLPFAIIPLLTFTSCRLTMAEFANSMPMVVVSNVLSITVLATNLFLAFVIIHARVTNYWPIYAVRKQLLLPHVTNIRYMNYALFGCFEGALVTSDTWFGICIVWSSRKAALPSLSSTNLVDSNLELEVTPPSSPTKDETVSATGELAQPDFNEVASTHLL
ncbi:hypothetical protein AHF37_05226 [Paragonimus kellicotti]|nr:hypothetical protein AHF37_05226 [Paragonimus kellicotti]